MYRVTGFAKMGDSLFRIHAGLCALVGEKHLAVGAAHHGDLKILRVEDAADIPHQVLDIGLLEKAFNKRNDS
jgi:hypothetical protein